MTPGQMRGCLLGGMLGDAWASAGVGGASGAYVPSWRCTDDTQLTLATCEAIETTGGVTPASIASCMLSWFRAGRLTGLGSSTLGALRALQMGAHWALAGRRGEYAAGNGAAMRIAPVAFVLDLEDTEDRRTFRDVVRITHHSEEALAGALAFAGALQHAARTSSWSAKELVGAAIDATFDSQTRDALGRLRPGES